MTVFKVSLILGLVMAGPACTNDGRQPGGIDAPDTRVENQTSEPAQLAFLDSRNFDEALSRSMSEGSPEITVKVPMGFTLNKIPERFDRWLYSVKEGSTLR